MITNGYWVPFHDNENIFLLVVIIAQHCKYAKHHWIVHFKRLHIMVGELYIAKAIKVVIWWMNKLEDQHDVQVSLHLVKKLYFWKQEPCSPRSFHHSIFKDAKMHKALSTILPSFSYLLNPWDGAYCSFFQFPVT